MMIYETVVMRIGKTANGHILRTKMAEETLSKLVGVPIVYNKDGAFKDYDSDGWEEKYKELPVVGKIVGNARIVGKKVLADIEMYDGCEGKWKGQQDNWLIDADLNTNKEIIIHGVQSIEVF